jgi:hypothetical protein
MSERNDSDSLPAIVGDLQVSKALGMHPDWVEHLESKGHLKSLGGRTRGCQRYYSSNYVLSWRTVQEWLDRAVKLVRRHFRGKNSAKCEGGSGE